MAKMTSELPSNKEIVAAMKSAMAIMGWTQEKFGSYCSVSRQTVMRWIKNPSVMPVYQLRVVETVCAKAGVKIGGVIS